MSRLYREGGHHPFAAGLIARGLTQDLAIYAGLPAHASVAAVAEGLQARSREDLSAGLRAIVRRAEETKSDKDLQQLAARAAELRNHIHPTGPQRAPVAASEES